MEENNNLSEKIEKLLEENLKLTQEVHLMTKKIKNYVTFQKILSVFYLLIFIIPLILSIIYLPVFLRNYLSPYQGLLNDNGKNINLNSPQGIGDVLNQAQNMLNQNNK